MKRIVGIAVAILALSAVVWAAQNPLLINGAGATFPYPIYSKWFDEYHKKDANIQFNYQSVGSGARHQASHRRHRRLRRYRRSNERRAVKGFPG